MLTNTRAFPRAFKRFKTKARRGEAVRVPDKEGEFLFKITTSRESLLGAAKGKFVYHDDQFDRIITATAKILRVPLATKDANIGDSDLVTIVWSPGTRV